MKSEHRTVLAIVLSTAVLAGWSWWSAKHQPPRVPAATSVAAPSSDVVSHATTSAAVAPMQVPALQTTPSISVQTQEVSTPLYSAVLTNEGGAITSWQLDAYRETAEKHSPDINLVPELLNGFPPLALQFTDANFVIPAQLRYEVVASSDRQVVYSWKSADLELIKTLNFAADRYAVDVNIELRNRSAQTLTGRPLLGWSTTSLQPESKGMLGFLHPPDANVRHPIYYLNGSTERKTHPADLPQKEELAGQLYWAGFEDRYFLTAIVPRTQSGAGTTATYTARQFTENNRPATAMTVQVGLPQIIVAPGASQTVSYTAYAGPKELDQLRLVGARLDTAVDYGWFGIVAEPILYLLKFFYGLVHNYGVAIILLTLLIKLLMHPLTKQSMKSMKAMQRLQPHLKALQEKYKNDREKLQQETMLLFRSHKVNPVGGCLPMLAQFPIYIALYKVLWNSIELYHAPFFWFYRDLSAPDPYFIMPILLGLFMFAQQKLMPTASADPAQQKIMLIMPVMFTAFMVFLPVGLVLYILVNTVATVAQQWMSNHDLRLRDVLRGKWTPRHMS